ncbi:MAG: ABC transporter ATP-binding protein [Acidobacteriota bacterium]
MKSSESSLLSHIKPFKSRLVVALFFMLMVSVFVGMLAIVIWPVINEISVSNSGEISEKSKIIREFILRLFGKESSDLKIILPQLLLITFFGNALFSFLSAYYMKTLGLKVVKNIRDKLYRSLIYKSIDFLSKARTGDLVSRISNDIDKIRFAVSETITIYIKESLTLIILLFIIFYLDWQMALISLVITPVAAIILKLFGKKVHKKVIQSQETIGELSSFLTETVSGNKIVKAYNMESSEINKFEDINEKHYKINARISFLSSLPSPLMNMIGGVVASVIFTMGMIRIANGSIDAGQFISFLASLFMMYDPLKRLSKAHIDFNQGKAGYERVMDVIRDVNPIKDIPDPVELGRVKGMVEFKNVSFAYEEEVPVINNMSFTVNPNEMVAIVGKSGSGKTTMMNLLLRFYENSDGEITIDGNDIKNVSMSSLRKNIGLVTQDVFLFNDSIRNNISYGIDNFSKEQFEKVSSISRSSEFIDELPDKYETRVGERGVLLSNGQRQRISIARAILKDPSVLIFDEATAALDNESEKLIQNAMEDVMKDRTSFVIAHRLSTIIEADRILVIEKGKIIESGNHSELIKKRGHYYSLYNLQFPDMDIIM